MRVINAIMTKVSPLMLPTPPCVVHQVDVNVGVAHQVDDVNLHDA